MLGVVVLSLRVALRSVCVSFRFVRALLSFVCLVRCWRRVCCIVFGVASLVSVRSFDVYQLWLLLHLCAVVIVLSVLIQLCASGLLLIIFGLDGVLRFCLVRL